MALEVLSKPLVRILEVDGLCHILPRGLWPVQTPPGFCCSSCTDAAQVAQIPLGGCVIELKPLFCFGKCFSRCTLCLGRIICLGLANVWVNGADRDAPRAALEMERSLGSQVLVFSCASRPCRSRIGFLSSAPVAPTAVSSSLPRLHMWLQSEVGHLGHLGCSAVQ